MMLAGMDKYTALKARADRCGCPWLEYDEKITAPLLLLLRLDWEQLTREGWFPRQVENGVATVIALEPTSALATRIAAQLGCSQVVFQVTLPADLTRIIEHNRDLNPGFPPPASRTRLARVRTHLAGRRSLFAHYRTLLAKSRTGLAFIRTGLSCITIALLFIRIFGDGYFLALEIPLLVVGAIMAYDGLRWYLPARKIHTRLPPCAPTVATNGSTVLTVANESTQPHFRRSPEIEGAAALRENWTALTPVMRRRYLASDRTDFAEERTILACYRTKMAKARTGLAFVRTGLGFITLGLALIRQFQTSHWLPLDLGLIAVGALMAGEGLLWYRSGREAGVAGHSSVSAGFQMATVWDYFFPHQAALPGHGNPIHLPLRPNQTPGIWATTGLALERTVLGERRNVMARLRTVMARSRTGLAFIRTGLGFFLIGAASEVYFSSPWLAWHLLDYTLIGSGLLLVADGLLWSIPAERLRRQFPYCTEGLEIVDADYGTPARYWRKAIFDHE